MAEVFRLLAWAWDVEKARALAEAEGELLAADPVQLRALNALININEEHAKTVNTDEPLILGEFQTLDKNVWPILLDGHHRLHKALVDGLPAVKLYKLSLKQTLACQLQGPRPSRTRRKRPRS